MSSWLEEGRKLYTPRQKAVLRFLDRVIAFEIRVLAPVVLGVCALIWIVRWLSP